MKKLTLILLVVIIGGLLSIFYSSHSHKIQSKAWPVDNISVITNADLYGTTIILDNNRGSFELDLKLFGIVRASEISASCIHNIWNIINYDYGNDRILAVFDFEKQLLIAEYPLDESIYRYRPVQLQAFPNGVWLDSNEDGMHVFRIINGKIEEAVVENPPIGASVVGAMSNGHLLAADKQGKKLWYASGGNSGWIENEMEWTQGYLSTIARDGGGVVFLMNTGRAITVDNDFGTLQVRRDVVSKLDKKLEISPGYQGARVNGDSQNSYLFVVESAERRQWYIQDSSGNRYHPKLKTLLSGMRSVVVNNCEHK